MKYSPKYVVSTTYNFSSGGSARMFSCWEKAIAFMKKSYERELKLANDMKEALIGYFVASRINLEEGYASITTISPMLPEEASTTHFNVVELEEDI